MNEVRPVEDYGVAKLVRDGIAGVRSRGQPNLSSSRLTVMRALQDALIFQYSVKILIFLKGNLLFFNFAANSHFIKALYRLNTPHICRPDCVGVFRVD